MRALFLFVIAAAFGFRVAVSPLAWGCATSAHHPTDGAGHHQEQHHHTGSDLPVCECVAHAASTGLVVEHPVLAAAVVQPLPVARYAALPTWVAGPSAHRLPFSIGPPSSLS